MSRFETRVTCLCILNSCATLDVGYENCVKKRNCEIDLIGCKTNLSALTPSDFLTQSILFHNWWILQHHHCY